MKDKPLIIANWKMNGSRAKVREDLRYYFMNSKINQANVIFALPNLYLETAYSELLINDSKCRLATQDVSRFAKYGAYTGEVSVDMLLEFGVQFVIVGHSERRLLCGDKEGLILEKLNNLLRCNVIPIYCIGESLDARKSGQYKDFLLNQLALLTQVQPEIQELVIAYEPIWAIGSGMIPKLIEIEEVMGLIWGFVQKNLGRVKITALYGGSVNARNITEILQVPLTQGVLVGGVSLKLNEFSELCNNII